MKYGLILSLLFLPLFLNAQEPVVDPLHLRVKVTNVISEKVEQLPGLDQKATIQTIQVVGLEDPIKGQEFVIENDYFKSKNGDVFFINYTPVDNGEPLIQVGEPDRRGVLISFGILAALAVIVFGGTQGVRSLVALSGSIVLIIFVLAPLLLSGAPPVLSSVAVAVVILALVMFLTHGAKRTTYAALIGTSGAVLCAGLLALLATYVAKISGFVSDEATFLFLTTNGAINLSGVFLGATIIGMLGVLDDVAITQAAMVREFLNSGLSRVETFYRAMRVGREHVGALVNTLALAYAGASLPLILLFTLSQESVSLILNREIFAGEIIRTAVGTIGLVLAVPLSTFAAILLLKRGEKVEGEHVHHHSHV